MNKLQKISLAILGGIETVFYMITPILISLIWINVFDTSKAGTLILYSVALIASVFRAIKIGWLRE